MLGCTFERARKKKINFFVSVHCKQQQIARSSTLVLLYCSTYWVIPELHVQVLLSTTVPGCLSTTSSLKRKPCSPVMQRSIIVIRQRDRLTKEMKFDSSVWFCLSLDILSSKSTKAPSTRGWGLYALFLILNKYFGLEKWWEYTVIAYVHEKTIHVKWKTSDSPYIENVQALFDRASLQLHLVSWT